MVATSSERADYYLYEDDEDTEWRIRVWDIHATGYDQISTVPPPGDRVRRNYPLAMMTDKIESHSTVTLPNRVVRDRLRAKQTAHPAPSGEAGTPPAASAAFDVEWGRAAQIDPAHSQILS
jgi:hypothetical protein